MVGVSIVLGLTPSSPGAGEEPGGAATTPARSPLLGVRGGKRLQIYADLFVSSGTYPWAGFKLDWTTFADNPSASEGTCSSWTTNTGNGFGNFTTADLTVVASEPCTASGFILCVQQ